MTRNGAQVERDFASGVAHGLQLAAERLEHVASERSRRAKELQGTALASWADQHVEVAKVLRTLAETLRESAGREGP